MELSSTTEYKQLPGVYQLTLESKLHQTSDYTSIVNNYLCLFNFYKSDIQPL